jgi:hypothetical protein
VLNHSPESGSAEGLVEFDPLIRDPTLADQCAQRRELEAVLVKLKAAESTENLNSGSKLLTTRHLCL